ncbi:MAG: DNA-protecting protein DprA [Epsilonproteobacteria bacterium]|nr:DNA-protecting protein DprA [Campylobacterota bacterium]
MFNTVPHHISDLESMQHYPKNLDYKGSLELLTRPKISIVGTRRPNPYTRSVTYELAKKLSVNGIVVVSGAAAGVDTIAHQGAGFENTIAVLPCGIELRYPKSNSELIKSIENKGLTLSQFESSFEARAWSFVVRNEIVVALGECLIVTEADIGSGSMRSVDYALEMGKQIYVLPHRIRESEGTHRLLAQGKATAIENIDDFVSHISNKTRNMTTDSPFLAFCRTLPSYEEVMLKFPKEIFEAELSGIVDVRNGRVVIV